MERGNTVAERRLQAASATLVRLSSLVVLLLVWEAAARIADSRLLPTVPAVFTALVQDTVSGSLLHDMSITLLRVAAAFALSMILGAALGIAMGSSRRLNSMLESWLLALLNVPAVVLIVLAYIWLGLNETAAIVAVTLNKLPVTAIAVREGTRAIDPALSEMARIFRVPLSRTLRHVVLPQLAPYFFSTARNGLSLIWKIVLVVELLGRSSGAGFRIQQFFQLFDVTNLLAYTVAFILLMQIIDWGVLQPLERYVSRWRR